MARALGVDLGSRRIGLASSDPSGVLASPWRTLVRSGDAAADRAAIVAAATEIGATVIVVGLPRSLSGADGPAARAARAAAAAIGAAADPVPVVLHDERFTTHSAARDLRAAGVRARDQRERIDAAAAAVLLQAWLDRRPAGEPAR